MPDKLTIDQALKLVQLLDDKLNRADFKRTQGLGVNFSGYYDRSTGRVMSGCSKVQCITSIVGYLNGNRFGASHESVVTWLDTNVPSWKEEIGYESKV